MIVRRLSPSRAHGLHEIPTSSCTLWMSVLLLVQFCLPWLNLGQALWPFQGLSVAGICVVWEDQREVALSLSPTCSHPGQSFLVPAQRRAQKLGTAYRSIKVGQVHILCRAVAQQQQLTKCTSLEGLQDPNHWFTAKRPREKYCPGDVQFHTS